MRLPPLASSWIFRSELSGRNDKLKLCRNLLDRSKHLIEDVSITSKLSKTRTIHRAVLRFESLEDRRMLACVFDAVPIDNVAPFANAAISQPLTNNRFSLSIDGASSCDPNGDELTYEWTVLQSPRLSNFSLDDRFAPSVNMTVDTEGQYWVQLVVNDGTRDSAPFQFPVDFSDTPNHGGPYHVVEGEDLQLFGSTSVAVPGGETSWHIGTGSFFGNDRLITWAELENSLGAETCGSVRTELGDVHRLRALSPSARRRLPSYQSTTRYHPTSLRQRRSSAISTATETWMRWDDPAFRKAHSSRLTSTMATERSPSKMRLPASPCRTPQRMRCSISI